MLELNVDQYWQTVVNTMMDGLMVVDLNGTIVFINRAFEEMSGYAKEELIGRSCQILECDTCRDALNKGGSKYCALFAERQVRRCRCTMKRKGGEPLPVLKNATVLKDLTGQIIGGVETFTDLRETVVKEEEIAKLRRQLAKKDGFKGIIGNHPKMQKVYEFIKSAANSEAPVIIYGESGTGKELVAAAIHRLSPRNSGPYIKVNCAAFNENLLESELFGHVKGAFTGADRTRIGRFEAAHRGSLFLDEVGDIPLATQVKLLRVLQEKEIERVGDHRSIPVDVRIISATNKDLRLLIENGLFREDFYYRIAVLPIRLPPLRERKEDIPLLVDYFASQMALKRGKPIKGISHEALTALMDYDWPGNVRELINVLEFAFVTCSEGFITVEHLPEHVITTGKEDQYNSDFVIYRPRRNVITRETIMKVLKETGGNKSEAARRLGISRVTLWKKMKQLDLPSGDSCNFPTDGPMRCG